jgi:hypothetical protein
MVLTLKMIAIAMCYQDYHSGKEVGGLEVLAGWCELIAERREGGSGGREETCSAGGSRVLVA